MTAQARAPVPAVLLAAFLAASPLAGQGDGETADPMVTDRPDFTESTSAVQRIQLEAGYTLDRTAGAEVHTLGEALLRLPATRDVEVRLGLSSYRWADAVAGADGFTDSSVGLKVRAGEGGPSPVLPSVAFLAGTTVPLGDASPAGLQPFTTLAFGWDLGPRLGLGANLGAAYLDAGRERYEEYSGSLALGVDAGGGLGVFLETYGFRPVGRPSTAFVDGGFTLGLTPDAQVDARVGTGVEGPAQDLVFGVGLSLRR